MTEKLEKWLKGVITVVEHQLQNLREKFDSWLQVTRRDMQATRHDLEAARREFEMRLAAEKSQTRRGDSGNAGTSIGWVKPPKFNG
jgi:ElaB/YqjD/DUF883 family membrane-anchored ribosome-binding protein